MLSIGKNNRINVLERKAKTGAAASAAAAAAAAAAAVAACALREKDACYTLVHPGEERIF